MKKRVLLTAKKPARINHKTLKRGVGIRHIPSDYDYIQSIQIQNPGFTNTSYNLLNQLLHSFEVGAFSEVRERIRNAIHTLRPQQSCASRTEWISCVNTCNNVLTDSIRTELKSTAYMLRCLSKSVITVDDSHIEFSADAPLTGLWKEDAKHIRIQSLNKDTAPSRFILGLGPSASGKTFWAKSLIEMMSSATNAMPKTFLAIDGGLYRQESIVYSFIIQEVRSICIAGFDNLMLSSWKLTESSMFDTGSVKKAIIQFLKDQTRPVSVYVPETLGDCGFGRLKYCSSKLKSFQQISRDSQWIAILIWQHKHASDCTYRDCYKCTGCTESGLLREKDEGKRYSNNSYEHSMSEGINVLNTAPGGSYKIHNSGNRLRKSFVEDFTDYSKHGDRQIQAMISSPITQQKYNYIYTTK
jgi:hypothetical protein